MPEHTAHDVRERETSILVADLLALANVYELEHDERDERVYRVRMLASRLPTLLQEARRRQWDAATLSGEELTALTACADKAERCLVQHAATLYPGDLAKITAARAALQRIASDAASVEAPHSPRPGGPQ